MPTDDRRRQKSPVGRNELDRTKREVDKLSEAVDSIQQNLHTVGSLALGGVLRQRCGQGSAASSIRKTWRPSALKGPPLKLRLYKRLVDYVAEQAARTPQQQRPSSDCNAAGICSGVAQQCTEASRLLDCTLGPGSPLQSRAVFFASSGPTPVSNEPLRRMLTAPRMQTRNSTAQSPRPRHVHHPRRPIQR